MNPKELLEKAKQHSDYDPEYPRIINLMHTEYGQDVSVPELMKFLVTEEKFGAVRIARTFFARGIQSVVRCMRNTECFDHIDIKLAVAEVFFDSGLGNVSPKWNETLAELLSEPIGTGIS